MLASNNLSLDQGQLVLCKAHSGYHMTKENTDKIRPVDERYKAL